MSICLMLHGIGPAPERVDPDERPYWISESTLAFVISEMLTQNVRLTLDDGNDSDARIVLPKLVDAGLTAAFFIPTDRIGTPGYVTEHDILELHQAGMEIASHGSAHLNWLKAGDAEIANDVTRSIERLSGIIKGPVRSVAIPYGYCDRRVLAVLRRIGIGRVYSSFRGPCADGAWLVRRDCITADMGPQEIRAVITRKPDAAESALTFLRIWRHTGNAAFWAA
jgi:peptidoglycan/xylan/chitin deacetylase (PgdA/CDA1 family)